LASRNGKKGQPQKRRTKHRKKKGNWENQLEEKKKKKLINSKKITALLVVENREKSRERGEGIGKKWSSGALKREGCGVR